MNDNAIVLAKQSCVNVLDKPLNFKVLVSYVNCQKSEFNFQACAKHTYVHVCLTTLALKEIILVVILVRMYACNITNS